MEEHGPETKRSARARLFLLVGSMGPFGAMPASGTVTVGVIGIPLYYLMHEWSATTYAVTVALFCLVSVWVHTRGDRILGEKDSRKIVWDELAGFLVAVAFLPAFTWQLAAAAFVVERLLDITKFPPANWVERRCPSGWGVVGDDLVAGAYTCGILHLAVAYTPAWLGLGVAPG